MALYFENKVQVPHPGSIHVDLAWHRQHPLLAVASYSEEKGGFVTLFSEEGEVLEGINFPFHPTAQVTSLSWHPIKKILAVGWENGELRMWLEEEEEFQEVQSLHRAPITLLQWSCHGARLISTDASGSLVGWKVDARGMLQTIFHHELKDPLSHITFRRTQKLPGFDISGLARAAVAGDEKALDLFSSWRPKTASQRYSFQPEHSENLCFFVGSISGCVYYINEHGNCMEALNTEGVIKKLLYHENKDCLVILTEGLNVGQFQVDSDGNLTEIMKVKLNGRSQDANMVWAGPGLLAVSAGELNVRCWNLDTGENYILLPEGRSSVGTTEHFTSLDFTKQKGILCGGTNLGSISMWKYEEDENESSEPEKNWVPQSACTINGSIKQVQWGTVQKMVAINTVRDIYILKEQIICAHYKDQVSAVQVSPTQLSVDLFASSTHMELKTDIQIKGVFVAVDHIVLWNGKHILVYEMVAESSHMRIAGSFQCDCESVVMHEHSLFIIEDDKIQVRTLQGTIKQTLNFLESEGKPICLDLCASYLTVATLNGVIKLWDLSRREAKPHSHPKNLTEVISDFGEIILARSNCTGTKVSITVAQANLLPDPKLFLWEIETDTVQYFNFATGKLDEEELKVPPNSAASIGSRESHEVAVTEKAQSYSAQEVAGRFVLSHYWDLEEPKLLVCEAKVLPQSKESAKLVRQKLSSLRSNKAIDVPEIILVTLFASTESGMIVQDSMPLHSSYCRLQGVQIPHYILLKKTNMVEKGTTSRLIDQVLMRDFDGLKATDKATRDAMINFSFYLSVGNMDEAFKAIKMIKSETVWENMAKMCVKTKRLDVASVCLGNMQHARGARMLRESTKERELDAQVAMLAVQLGLLGEAEKLYKNCGRYDLLNKFYQDTGQWEKAIEVTQTQDRIHLRNTFYNYAKHLESKTDINGAIQMYEKSETHRFEIPRMLFDDPNMLENYIVKTKDKTLQKWWAQYMESTGEMETALLYYNMAQDYLSLVRVHCYCESYGVAAEIANESGDRAACYHLARQYENMSNIKEAIHFFTRAQAYGNAIRICKEHGLDEQLWNLALLATPQEQLEAARYFEIGDHPSPEKAVMLYHRAGMLHKALDLAFRTQQFNALQYIAVDLDSRSDPALVHRCAKFFMENKQFDKAVDLLAIGKKYFEALDLCVEHNIPVTEELADRLTIPKGEGDDAARTKVLEKVAECAFTQGNYHLATIKYTQAGNKVNAMKALLKSGDTEKIIKFATVSRQREIYILAGNYLQSLDWRNSPEVMKNVISFYSKGQAKDLLAGFYEACAQVEIDEFQNYEKALGALMEANRCLSRLTGKNAEDNQRKLESLNNRLQLIKQFVDTRRMYESNPDEAMNQCRQLLETKNLDNSVRQGDVFGFMIEHCVRQKNYKGAYQLMEEMKTRIPNVNLAYYVNISTIEAVSKALDLPIIRSNRANSSKSEERGKEEVEEDSGEEIAEEVADEDLYPAPHMNGKAFPV